MGDIDEKRVKNTLKKKSNQENYLKIAEIAGDNREREKYMDDSILWKT